MLSSGLALLVVGASPFLQPARTAPWLLDLAAPAIVRELQEVADGAFVPDFQNLTLPGTAPEGWASVTLLNKGQIAPQGCAHAPRTCTVLRALLQRGYLLPTSIAPEVGVRLLRLAPGAALRPHRGPGGRLVAHVGVRVPPGGAASLTVDGERHALRRQGQLLLFDDSHLHWAANKHPEAARVVLHVAFSAAMVAPTVATICTPAFCVDVFADCTARTTLLADGRQSALQPLLTLYNRVSDNRPSDLDACVSVRAVDTGIAGNATSGVLRVTAAHGAGTVDLRWVVPRPAAWFTLELLSLAGWVGADPVERHMQLARLDSGLLDPTKAPFISGKFQGCRGTEGLEEWSAGFFTLSSEWQQYNSFFYAEEGQRVAFTVARTANLPQTWAALAVAEGLPSPSANRAVSWYWTLPDETSEATIHTVIARAKALGARLVFFLQMTSNIGDYVADPVRFPSGFGQTADTVRAAGLDVGIHVVSPGAHRRGTAAANGSAAMLDLFVPQGVTTRDYNGPTDAGTWWCHEGAGDTAWDHTRHPDSNLPPSEQPPLGNPLRLVGNPVRWSKLGTFRNGSALSFGGGFDADGASYGALEHVAEYNFNGTMSLQMTVHVGVARNSSAASMALVEQTLAAKRGAWRLSIDTLGHAQWHVTFADGGTATAVGATPLTPDDPAHHGRGGPWVLKATASAGVARLHLCAVADEGALRNRCRMHEDATATTTGAPTALLARTNASITVGASLGNSAFRACASCFVGATATAPRFWCPASAALREWSCEATNRPTPGTGQLNCYNADGCDLWAERNPFATATTNATGHQAVVGAPFTGAIEEIMLSKVDTSDWLAMNWNCPATGMVDFYIW